MQYLALIYGEEARWANLSPEEREREMGEYVGALGGGRDAGAAASSTRSPRRPRSACGATRPSSPTAPSSSSKETLGGYYVFECDSFDEACTWAAKIPAARHGAIEVRPVYVDGGEQS